MRQNGTTVPRRVVITGLGAVTPIGLGVTDFWAALLAGKSGIRNITAFDASRLPSRVAGDVQHFEIREFIRHGRRPPTARFSAFAVAAARLAVDHAKLWRNGTSVGVCIGSSVQGNADIGEGAFAKFRDHGWQSLGVGPSLEVTAHSASSYVQRELQVSGPLMTVASACCTGIDSIAWGTDQIKSGAADAAIVGAAEAPLSQFTFGLFSASGFLSTWTGPAAEASRPYDRQREGLVLSEAAGVIVLEELEHAVARGAEIFGEILGYASYAEESSIREPHDRYAAALQQSILAAIGRSHLESRDIDYVCAHGNSTKFDDEAEAAAHRNAFGKHAYSLAISSIKSMIGQPFSAGGVLQVVAATLATYHNVVPPTINLTNPDPKCDLDYVPNRPRAARVKHAVVHSHSLGGHVPGSHSALVIGASRHIR
jgi:3-oxoacyl-[acyl-carrier-protein] synthase II